MTTTTLKLQSLHQTGSIHAAFVMVWTQIQNWRDRARQRAQLTQLTADRLNDIGVTAEAASAEAAKPFWVK